MSSPEWQAYLCAYYEQKRLERYQQERVLPKPKTTKLTVVLYVAGLLVMLFGGIVMLLAVSALVMWLNALISMLYVICVAETYGRLLGVKIVECYQHYAPDETRRKCKCVPSCSEYAILCLKKYELFYSLLKIRKRLFVTCKGFDYIIDYP